MSFYGTVLFLTKGVLDKVTSGKVKANVKGVSSLVCDCGNSLFYTLPGLEQTVKESYVCTNCGSGYVRKDGRFIYVECS